MTPPAGWTWGEDEYDSHISVREAITAAVVDQLNNTEAWVTGPDGSNYRIRVSVMLDECRPVSGAPPAAATITNNPQEHTMNTYWLTFTDGTQGACDGQNEFDAKTIAEYFTGKKVAGRGLPGHCRQAAPLSHARHDLAV